MRFRALAVLGILAASLACHAQQFKFVITGDSRSDGLPGRKGYDENGINKTITKEIVAEILRQKAKFVLITGDLVLGYTDAETFRTQLTSWLILNAPLYDRQIGVYPVRGNHDSHDSSGADTDESVWDTVLSGRYRLPDNGPQGEKNATWSFTYENSLFIGVDEWGSHEHAVNQKWLDQQLANTKATHIFVMGHEMAFKAGHHTDNLDNHPAARDAFIKSLIRAGSHMYICGHDHFYDRSQIGDPDHPGWDFTQLLVGTAGAPFYHGDKHNGNNGRWMVTPQKHIEDTYGYTLAEIDGPKATFTFYGRVAPGEYEPMDKFSYNANPRE